MATENTPRATTSRSIAEVRLISLQELERAMARALILCAQMLPALDSPRQATMTAHMEQLAADLRVLRIVIAAAQFPPAESLEDTLGNDVTERLADGIARLDALGAADQNFQALLQIGVGLGAAALRVRDSLA